MDLERQRNYVLWLLGQRDYPRHKLVEKLMKREMTSEQAHQLIDELRDVGLFREQAFAKSRTRTLLQRGYGPKLVQARMSYERVPIEPTDVKDAFDALGITEEDQVQKLVVKAHSKYSKSKKITDERMLQNKVVQSVCQKGHSFDLVKKIYRKISEK